MARLTGWTMAEVRAHTARDMAAMAAVMEQEQRDRERAERRGAARAESRRMSR